MDITAPIEPGNSAAGIRLGAAITAVPEVRSGLFRLSYFASPNAPGTFVTRYRRPEVELWESNGLITRIILHSGYKGLFEDAIGIGSTIAELEELAGPWSTDEAGNVIPDDIPGIAFTVDDPFLLSAEATAGDARITAITLDLPTRWP